MGALDGYWIPHHGVIQRGVDTSKPAQPPGFYVSWDGTSGGATGQWHDTIEEAEDTLQLKELKNSARWYKQTGESL